jgi:uncharacterized membrane protein YdbT with pleckstrin-like domain
METPISPTATPGPAAGASPAPATLPPEQVVWTGHPSQFTGTSMHLAAIILVALGVAGGYWLSIWVLALVWLGVMMAWWKYLTIRATTYRLTTERLITGQGVFSHRTDEIELYRVKDTTVVQVLWARLANRGDVILVTSDATSPVQVLHAVARPGEVRELIRKHVEAIRTAKGVREVDME